ncbi:MAG: hypothetical protein AAFX01_00195 [Cyanobacteria bacterium J06638_28]
MASTSWLTKAIVSPQKGVRKLTKIADHTLQDWQRSLLQKSAWSSLVNETENRIVGLRRTGNHAITMWIKAQTPGASKHLNNLEPLVNPYRYKYEVLRDFYPQHQWAIKQLEPFAKGNFVPLERLLYSYEDHDLKRIVHPSFERKHDLYLGYTGKRIDVLIMRDPFNLFASRLKSKMFSVKNASRTVADLWLEYAREYLGETSYLPQERVCINYNTWSQEKDYRQEIAQKLGLEFTDEGRDQVSGCGGGSSFDSTAFQGQASQMPVLKRWETMAADPRFQNMLKDQQVWAYSERIFGSIPGTEALRQKLAASL